MELKILRSAWYWSILFSVLEREKSLGQASEISQSVPLFQAKKKPISPKFLIKVGLQVENSSFFSAKT